MKPMNICVTVNSGYVRYLHIMLLSLYQNNDRGSIRLFVIQKDFTLKDRDIIKSLSSSYENEVVFIDAAPNAYHEFPSNLLREILFRLKIPEYLPKELDRVLLLDADLLVLNSINTLYEIELNDAYFAASPNMLGKGVVLERNRAWYPKDRMDWTHFNTGVLLYNLKKIREDLSQDWLFNKGKKYVNDILAPTFEEELINIEFGEHGILRIDPYKWNYIPSLYSYDIRDDYMIYGSNDEIKKNCTIMHFAQLSPWNQGVKNDAFKIWWEYAKQSDYYTELLEENYWRAEDYIKNIPNIAENAESKLRDIDFLLEDKRQRDFVENLKADQINRILVYGAGRIARCIDIALRDTDIDIVAYIDKTYRGMFCGKPEIGFEDIKKFDADVIIVSNGIYFNDVIRDLDTYTDIPIRRLDHYFTTEGRCSV